MKHLEFVDKLNEFGITSTKTEGKTIEIDISTQFGAQSILIKDSKLTFKNPAYGCDPLIGLIRYGIDVDSWKHSWHHEILPENYEIFREIIQKKILEKAKLVDELLNIYFQLNHELVNLEK